MHGFIGCIQNSSCVLCQQCHYKHAEYESYDPDREGASPLIGRQHTCWPTPVGTRQWDPDGQECTPLMWWNTALPVRTSTEQTLETISSGIGPPVQCETCPLSNSKMENSQKVTGHFMEPNVDVFHKGFSLYIFFFFF